MAIGEANIEIDVDIPHLRGQLSKAKQVLESETSGVDSKLKQKGKKGGTSFSEGLKDGLSSLKDKMGGIGKGGGSSLMSGMGGAIAAGTAGVVAALAAVLALMTKSIQKFVQTESKLLRLEAAFKSTGMAAGFTRESVERLATEMSETSFLSKDQLLEAAAILSSFKDITGDTFEDALRTSADLAVLMGTDVKSAAMQLGKALSDPARNMGMLREAGVAFSEDQVEVIKRLQETEGTAAAANKVLEIMAENGAKDVANQTDNAAGSFAKLTNATENLLGATGELLAADGSLSTMLDGLTEGMNTSAEAPKKSAGVVRFFSDVYREAMGENVDATANFANELLKQDENLQRLAKHIANLRQKSQDLGDIQLKNARETITAFNEIIAKQEERAEVTEQLAETEKTLHDHFVKRHEDQIRLSKRGLELNKKTAEERIKSEKAITDEAVKNLDKMRKGNKADADERIKEIDKEIEAIRKRKNEDIRLGTGGASDLQTQVQEDALEQLNEKKRKAREDELEGLKRQKEAIRELLKTADEMAAKEIERVKEESAAKIEAIKSEQKARDEAHKKRMEQLKEAVKVGKETVKRGVAEEKQFIERSDARVRVIDEVLGGFSGKGEGLADKVGTALEPLFRELSKPGIGEAVRDEMLKTIKDARKTLIGTRDIVKGDEQLQDKITQQLKLLSTAERNVNRRFEEGQKVTEELEKAAKEATQQRLVEVGESILSAVQAGGFGLFR